MTRNADKQEARILREEGWSLHKISDHLKCSKSSVSLWVRDIIPAGIHRVNLKNQKLAVEAVKRARDERWRKYRHEAEQEWELLRNNPNFMLGLGLYMGEGSKSEPNVVSLSNCDAKIHLGFLRFLSVVGVPNKELVFAVYAHEPNKSIVEYWAGVLGTEHPQIRMYKALVSKASKRKRRIQPFGTLTIKVRRSTWLRQKIERWMTLAVS